MSKPNTTCRVCGKKYFCCSDSRDINSWKTMACSQECYKEYMRRIELSRKPKVYKVEINEKAEETNEEKSLGKMQYGKKKTANEAVKTEKIIGD